MAANESGVVALSNKIAYSGAGVAAGSGTYGWLADNHHLVASCGVLVGIAVAIYGAYLQSKKHGREQREHEVRMRKLLED